MPHILDVSSCSTEAHCFPLFACGRPNAQHNGPQISSRVATVGSCETLLSRTASFIHQLRDAKLLYKRVLGPNYLVRQGTSVLVTRVSQIGEGQPVLEVDPGSSDLARQVRLADANITGRERNGGLSVKGRQQCTGNNSYIQCAARGTTCQTRGIASLRQRRSVPDGRQASQSDSASTCGQSVHLVALCAAHVNTPARLRRLQQMLHSWERQHVPVSLHISLSFDATLRSHIQSSILSHCNPQLSVLVSETPLRQGEHYARLVSALSPSSPPRPAAAQSHTWVMFTDDDDLWHASRSAMYTRAVTAALAQQTYGMPHGFSSVVFPVHVGHPVGGVTRKGCMHSGKQAVESPVDGPDEVEQLLAAGRLVMERLLLLGVGSYWGYCCSWGTLTDFLTRAEPRLLQHSFWDVCLVSFLRQSGTINADDVIPVEGWLYYWRVDTAAAHGNKKSLPQAPQNIMDEALALLKTTLCLYCALHSQFDGHQFWEFAVANDGLPEGLPQADVERHVATWMKEDPQFHLLLSSPQPQCPLLVPPWCSGAST